MEKETISLRVHYRKSLKEEDRKGYRAERAWKSDEILFQIKHTLRTNE